MGKLFVLIGHFVKKAGECQKNAPGLLKKDLGSSFRGLEEPRSATGAALRAECKHVRDQKRDQKIEVL